MPGVRTSTAIACRIRTTDTVGHLRPNSVAVLVCIVLARRPLLSLPPPVTDEQQRRNVLCSRKGARDRDSRFSDNHACRLYFQRRRPVAGSEETLRICHRQLTAGHEPEGAGNVSGRSLDGGNVHFAQRGTIPIYMSWTNGDIPC
jgi:hypothetical protein